MSALVAISVMGGLSSCSDGQAATAEATDSVTVTGLPTGHEVTIREAGKVTTAPGPGTRAASHVYDLGPSGKLPATAHIEIELEATLPARTPVVVATRESTEEKWTYLSATLDDDRRHVGFTTTHFSLFTVLALDAQALFEEFRKSFLDGFTADLTAKAEPPRCDREDDARRDGFKITNKGPGTIYWCFGIENGHRVLKATNRRGYPLTVQHPNMAVISNPPPDLLAWSNLSRLGSGKDFILAPGGTATLNADLGPGQIEGISTDVDAIGQTFYAMQTGITALSSILTRFGATPTKNAADKLLNSVDCLNALSLSWGHAFSECLSPADVLETFGPTGIVLAPLMAAAPVAAFFKSQGEAALSQFNGTDDYEVVITRAAQNAPISEDWWELNALCRGAVNPDASTEAACDRRDALTKSLALATAREFIAAWKARDEDAMAAVATSPSAVASALRWHLAAEPDPKCDYDPTEPTMYCWVYATTGGVGFPLELSTPLPGHPLKWKVRGAAPDIGF